MGLSFCELGTFCPIVSSITPMFQAHFGYIFFPGGVSELVLPKLARKIKNKKNLYRDIYENVLRELGTLLLPSLKTLSLFKELLHQKILSQSHDHTQDLEKKRISKNDFFDRLLTL